MNDPLKRRLTGALVLLLLAFGLAFLLPDPDRPRIDQDLRQVTIDLRNPGPDLAPAGEPLTPPSIAAPRPVAPPLPQNEVAAAGDEPQIEIEEPLPGRSTAAPPLSIRPSESLGQESQDRGVAPSPPQSAPPVQLRHSEVLHDLQKPPPEPPAPALPAVAPKPQPKPQPTPPAKPLPPPVVAATKPETPPAPRPAPPPKPAPVKPEPVKPEAPAASPPAPAGKTRWTVQVGSYSEIANARNAEAKLKASGLPTLMSPVDTPKGTLYRVRVGPFGSEVQAQAARGKATQLGFAQATIRKD